ncbi:MAG: caspase domain-containing protein [Rhizobiaceae bacterium]
MGWLYEASRAAFLVLFLSATGLASQQAVAQEKRVALVLANAAYQHTPRLLNPVRDGEAIANRLRELDFEVITGFDLTTAESEALVARFGREVRGADIALFYYAGHALQLDGENYLIPVNAAVEDETSLDFEAIRLELVLRQMSRDTNSRLVFIDASLANPLADKLSASGGNALLGLAEVEAPKGGNGGLVAMAAGPNQVVEEIVGTHSPFSGALLAHLGTANATIADALAQIEGEIAQVTGNKQKPWVVSSLASDVVLRTVDMNAPLIVGEADQPADGQAAAVAPPPQDQAALEALRAKIPELASNSPIFFDIPIQFGDPAIDGKSISMLIQGKPLFSPVEGLETKVWDNHCSACHQWTKERLCEQAKVYANTDIAVLRLPHPLGERFKVALGMWAKNDCQ